MKEQLQALRALQQIDNEMSAAQQSNIELNAQLADLRQGLELLRADLGKQQTLLTETQELKEDQEGALKSHEEALARSKARLTQVKGNREFMAVQREIENSRKAISTKEEEVLKIFEVEEQVREALTKRQDKLDTLAAAADDFEAKFGGRSKEVSDRLADLQVRREEQVAILTKKLYRKYERIRKNRDGLALSRALDEACGACHMNIPPQLYNELQRGDVIAICPHCNRILYFEAPKQDESEQVAG